jgi:hypothetical protein
VLSRAAKITARRKGCQINTPTSALLTPADDLRYYVDGRLWPAVSADGLLVPAGLHTISTEPGWWHFFETEGFQARIVSCTADLLEAEADPTALTIHYVAPGRAVIAFDQPPRAILVDGKEATLPVERGGRNWAVVFPAGDHRVLVITNTRAGVAVNVLGWASASAIGAFGILVTILMAVIYLQLRVRRLIKRNS